jgi:ammonia channel protein AmtB
MVGGRHGWKRGAIEGKFDMTMGLRVSEERAREGLDTSSQGERA